MSTPKINFFIQAGHRGIFTGPCPGPVRASDKQLFGLSPRQLPGTGFRRAAGMSPGKIRGTPRCAQRVMTPNPNNCSRSRNPEVAIPNPDGTITRTIYRFNPEARAGDPEVRSRTPNIPNISRWAGGCPTPPRDPAIPLGFRYLLLLGFVRLLWEFLLV